MKTNEQLVLNVKAHNAYLYDQNDLTKLMVLTSGAADDGAVTVTAGPKKMIEYYHGPFNSYLGNKLQLDTTSLTDKVSSVVPEITVEQTPVSINVSAGVHSWRVLKAHDKLGMHTIAAPYKGSFKPLATRYELGMEDMNHLRDTFSKLFKNDTVYRISGTANTEPSFGYMTLDELLNIAGVSPLRSGAGVCKHKGIKVFKLANGLGLKLGDSVMVAITEATPRFKEKEQLFVRQEDPDTNRWYLEPVVVKISKGFNPNLKQYAYDVTMKNGNQLFDIPESDLLVDKVSESQKSINDVSFDHFS